MNYEQQAVKKFHKTFGLPVANKPKVLSIEAKNRRRKLMTEELLELIDAMMIEDLTSIADGICDLLYVVYGTAVEAGLDIKPLFTEVHRSNMTKVGGSLNEFGKWIKPETYDPPHLEPLIKKQLTTSK